MNRTQTGSQMRFLAGYLLIMFGLAATGCADGGTDEAARAPDDGETVAESVEAIAGMRGDFNGDSLVDLGFLTVSSEGKLVATELLNRGDGQFVHRTALASDGKIPAIDSVAWTSSDALSLDILAKRVPGLRKAMSASRIATDQKLTTQNNWDQCSDGLVCAWESAGFSGPFGWMIWWKPYVCAEDMTNFNDMMSAYSNRTDDAYFYWTDTWYNGERGTMNAHSGDDSIHQFPQWWDERMSSFQRQDGYCTWHSNYAW